MKYKRILLKLSGEALMGDQQFGIDGERLKDYAREIQQVIDEGAQVAIVIGGGISSAVFRERAKEWTGYKATTWACSRP